MPAGDRFADNPIDALDADIAAACAHRRVMFRKLFARDDDTNRQAFDDATEHVDGLLEMRHAMSRAEGMVTP